MYSAVRNIPTVILQLLVEREEIAGGSAFCAAYAERKIASVYQDAIFAEGIFRID